MNPWTRDILGDLACAHYSCGLEPIPCMEGALHFIPISIQTGRATQAMLAVLPALVRSYMHGIGRIQVHHTFFDVLDLHWSHTHDPQTCVPSAEEEYLQGAVDPVAYYVGPEMQALQTASSAVSRMVKKEVCSPFCTTD